MEHFIHLLEFQVIICKKCKYCVLPSHIDTHFASKAHKLERNERRRIADEVAEINGLIGNEETLARRLPEENALQCTLPIAGEPCTYICCMPRQMRAHCMEEHGWKSKQKGRPKKGKQDVPWRSGVHCQRFFAQGPKSRFFEVQGKESQPSPQEMRSRTHQFRTARREMEAAFRWAEEKERREIKEADEHREPNPWLRRVGWAAHLAGLDRGEIRGWVEMPDDDEPELQTVCKAFDWMIREAQYITVQEVVGQAALFEVHWKEVTQEARMPFDSWMDITTVRSYTQIWRQLLCYVFRAEGEKPEDRLAYKLTERQKINNEYKSVIISGLAVLGIRNNDGWLNAEDYTSKYSAVAKLARMMVVYKGYEQRQEEIKRKTEANERQENRLTAEEIGEAARSYFHYIRRLTYQFMTMAHDGRDPTPMQWIYKARQVRSMVQGSDGFASVPTDAPPIDWDHIVDNPSESRVGWSFLDDDRSRFAVDGQWWLYKRMYHEQRLREQFTDQGEDGSPQISAQAAMTYQEGVGRFQELLLILMQFWGGLPSRATEILGARWKNTGQGGIRNIFIEDSSPFLWGDSEKKDHQQWTGPKRRPRGRDGERVHGIGQETREETPLPHPRRSHDWTSERMRKIMQSASERWIGEKIHISAWRQIAIAISRRYCKENAFPRDEFDPEGGGGDDSDDDNLLDLQAGHTTQVAGLIYRRDQAWQAFLQMTLEADETKSGVKRKREDGEDDIPSVEMIRWKRLREVDISQQLKEMIGPEAEFRGQQEPALRAIIKGVSPVLVIMGTGGGKTMLFQLPARSQKGGTTIVIVPLKSLEESLHERCMELGISSIQWDGSQQERMAQVVFVQPESVITVSFARYLNRLQGLGQLVRVVFDECHTIEDSQADFRPDIKKASEAMVRRRVQMIYLTATLAPVDMPEFMEVIKVEIPEDNIFRGSTSRRNIAYSVVEHKGDVEEVQAMKSYGQESGRAGRDGKRSEAIILVGSGRQEALKRHYERIQQQGVVPQVAITKEDKKRAEQDKVGRFISGARCRRVHLDQAMDNRFNRARCEEGKEVCDLCGKEDAIVGEADALQEAYNVEQGQGEEEQGEGDRHEQSKRQEPRLDSGIDIPSSSGIYSSTPTATYVLPSSPPIRIGARLEEMNQMGGNGESSARVNRANEYEAHYRGRSICIPSTAGRTRAVPDVRPVADTAGEPGDSRIRTAVGGFK
ncbi:hypothetical protein V496_01286 [Pseudogymnoascus sp. VKM F-4515 (FW-2607)]|nr:hypothetical protein V496_01286 [Pseudogymnoascus sp. VKM F-4515 (FW-2607)]